MIDSGKPVNGPTPKAMKVTPLQLAHVCQAIYGDDNPAGITFDQLWNFGGTIAGHTMIGDEHVIAYRASKVLLDWMRNIEAAPELDADLGMVHPGFHYGVRQVVAAASKIIPGLTWANTAICGHSLAAARAPLHAGHCAYAGTPVGLVCMFAPPKPAFVNLRRVLEKTNTPMIAYTNRHDIVPKMPMILPWWSHVVDPIHLDIPADGDDINWWRDHALALHITGIEKLAQSPPPLDAAT